MKIPPMTCERCGECCGVVAVTEAELDLVRVYAFTHHITPVAQGVTCPFYQEQRCMVYPVRPLICRMFGHTPNLQCARGHNVNLRERQVYRPLERNGKPTRTLQELAGISAEALLRILKVAERPRQTRPV